MQDAIAMVRGYLDHLENPEYVRSVFADVGLNDLVLCLSHMLRSTDEDVADACLLIRDMVTVAPTDERRCFLGAFEAGPLVHQLEGLLRSGTFAARRHANYTLGKTCHKQSVPALRDAFGNWLTRDPLLLPQLVFELWWLEGSDRTFGELGPMLASSEPVTRWAVLPIVESHFSTHEDAVRRAAYVDPLIQDPHPLVRAEALWTRDHGGGSSRESSPLITFDDLQNWFSGHLLQKHMTDYTISDLHQFMDKRLPEHASEKERFTRNQEVAGH